MQTQTSRLKSLALHNNFRGIFVEYDSMHGTRLLQIGFKTTKCSIDHLLNSVEEAIEHFVDHKVSESCGEGFLQTLRSLLRSRVLGERVFSVAAGYRLRSVNNAVIVDVINSASPKDRLIAGPGEDLASSWRIKARSEVEDEEMELTRSPSSKDTTLSRNSVQNVLAYKNRKQVGGEVVLDDSLDALFHAVSTTKS